MFYSSYTKKEDARDIPKYQRIMLGIVLLSMGMVLAVMIFSVLPRLLELYVSANIQQPWQVENSMMIGILALAVYVFSGLYFLLTQPDYSVADEVAKKYKKGEMIKSRELMEGRKYELLFVLSLIPVGLYVAGVMILPINSITSSL